MRSPRREDISDMEIEELRHYINSFSFEKCKKGSQGFRRILVQLFGLLGHGKSSFINNCIYVLEDGEYQNWARAEEKDGGSTLERIQYELTGNITLVDNRGLGKLDGYETGEIFAQLGNLLPMGKIEWAKGFMLADRITRAEKSMETSDFIFPVYVHSVALSTPPEEKEIIMDVLQRSRELTGVPPIVVLTHKSSGNLTDTENTFRDMGIERIFSFENYTRKDHMKTRGRHEEVLKFLYEVIEAVKFRVEHLPQDPVSEMMERKLFVLNYIHECAKKGDQEKIYKQKAMEKARLRRSEQLEEEMERQREKERQEQDMERTKEESERQRQIELPKQQEERRKKKKKWWRLLC